jgi:hypothetical protein
MYGHTRSQSPPPMPRHRSNGPNGPGQMLPVYATRPAPPNGPVPVYAMPQPAPQAPMEPQVSEPDSAPGATPAEAPQMVEPRPAEPEVFSRQRSQSGLSVEILQELGDLDEVECCCGSETWGSSKNLRVLEQEELYTTYNYKYLYMMLSSMVHCSRRRWPEKCSYVVHVYVCVLDCEMEYLEVVVVI